MTHYRFKYHCADCDEDSPMRYEVPNHAGTTNVILSCKKCETPVLEIVYNYDQTGVWTITRYHRYKVFNLLNRKWILGNADTFVDSGALRGWVVDHRGERTED